MGTWWRAPVDFTGVGGSLLTWFCLLCLGDQLWLSEEGSENKLSCSGDRDCQWETEPVNTSLIVLADKNGPDPWPVPALFRGISSPSAQYCACHRTWWHAVTHGADLGSRHLWEVESVHRCQTLRCVFTEAPFPWARKQLHGLWALGKISRLWTWHLERLCSFITDFYHCPKGNVNLCLTADLALWDTFPEVYTFIPQKSPLWGDEGHPNGAGNWTGLGYWQDTIQPLYYLLAPEEPSCYLHIRLRKMKSSKVN